MVAIHLKGQIDENGKLNVDLPEGLSPGEVDITIELPSDDNVHTELRPWADDELAALMNVTPMTGAEIVAWLRETGGWEGQDIPDGATWVEEQRRRYQRNFPEW